jgi:signal transduction histidine kinase
MILNLVLNAVDAMTAVPETAHILNISARSFKANGRPAVLVTVRDTGCGFAAEDSERLFEALHSTKANGFGMGLRISRSIAEAHGGQLWAQSNQDAGATFLFSLPVIRG